MTVQDEQKPKIKCDNPLFKKTVDSVAVNTADLDAPSVFNSSRTRNREMGKFIRKESAAEAISQFTQETDVFGFTKGQFSLIELIEAAIEKTGKAYLMVSTWTAATADLANVDKFISSGKIISARFLLDFTFQQRQPGVAKKIRDVFGLEALRVTRNHAKFFQLYNDTGWNVTCKTSMNLNQNPRFEDFDISNDPELFKFLKKITDELFAKTASKKQAMLTTNQLQHQFMGF